MAKRKTRHKAKLDGAWQMSPEPTPRLWLVWAYRYVPEYRLFDVGGDVFGVIEQEPLEYVWEGRPPYEEDGSVYMTPKQAHRMVELSDYDNYLDYALESDGPPEPQADTPPEDWDCPHCHTPMECVNPDGPTYFCEVCHLEGDADELGHLQTGRKRHRADRRTRQPGSSPSKNALRKRRRKQRKRDAKAASAASSASVAAPIQRAVSP